MSDDRGAEWYSMQDKICAIHPEDTHKVAKLACSKVIADTAGFVGPRFLIIRPRKQQVASAAQMVMRSALRGSMIADTAGFAGHHFLIIRPQQQRVAQMAQMVMHSAS
jgi:preprotein translocase subunit YajC